jgi:hypothetical protein
VGGRLLAFSFVLSGLNLLARGRVVWPLVCTTVLRKQSNKPGDTTLMAIEKKSLVSKKTATPSKSTKSKVDTGKPAASKVIAAKPGPYFKP